MKVILIIFIPSISKLLKELFKKLNGLIDILSDQSMKLTFDWICPDKLWLSIIKEHPELTKVALNC